MFTKRRVLAIAVFCAASLAWNISAAPSLPQNPPQGQPDNSRNNKDQSAPTADQQKSNAADRDLVQKIRKSIMADKSLSTYAHNVKIIAQDGKVTLRGPVRTDDEKRSVEAKATEVAGEGNVNNDIEVAPKQQ